ncbi:MAG: type VI secretion system baseplate subunit TssE [Acidobacteriota bacterium]
MARKPNERTILPSVLDRLIDLEPGNRKEAQVARAQSLRELKDSVRRDLEWLLNTRRTPEEPAPTATELARSTYCYGLPDITGMALNTQASREELAHSLERAISAFEPRLINVAVSMDTGPSSGRTLRFQIEALLRTEPAPSRIFFDTRLELIRGEYEVVGETNAR